MPVRGNFREAKFHIHAVDVVERKRVSGGTDTQHVRRSPEVILEAVAFQKILAYLCADVPAPEKDAQGRVPFLRWERIQRLGRVCRGWYEHLRDADKPHPLGDFRLPRVVGAARSTPGPTTAPSLRVRKKGIDFLVNHGVCPAHIAPTAFNHCVYDLPWAKVPLEGASDLGIGYREHHVLCFHVAGEMTPQCVNLGTEEGPGETEEPYHLEFSDYVREVRKMRWIQTNPRQVKAICSDLFTKGGAAALTHDNVLQVAGTFPLCVRARAELAALVPAPDAAVAAPPEGEDDHSRVDHYQAQTRQARAAFHNPRTGGGVRDFYLQLQTLHGKHNEKFGKAWARKVVAGAPFYRVSTAKMAPAVKQLVDKVSRLAIAFYDAFSEYDTILKEIKAQDDSDADNTPGDQDDQDDAQTEATADASSLEGLEGLEALQDVQSAADDVFGAFGIREGAVPIADAPSSPAAPLPLVVATPSPLTVPDAGMAAMVLRTAPSSQGRRRSPAFAERAGTSPSPSAASRTRRRSDAVLVAPASCDLTPPAAAPRLSTEERDAHIASLRKDKYEIQELEPCPCLPNDHGNERMQRYLARRCQPYETAWPCPDSMVEARTLYWNWYQMSATGSGSFRKTARVDATGYFTLCAEKKGAPARLYVKRWVGGRVRMDDPMSIVCTLKCDDFLDLA